MAYTQFIIIILRGPSIAAMNIHLSRTYWHSSARELVIVQELRKKKLVSGVELPFLLRLIEEGKLSNNGDICRRLGCMLHASRPCHVLTPGFDHI